MKKSTLMIILVIFLLLMGVIVHNQYSNQQNKTIKVDEAYFTIPSDYYEGTLNKDNDVNLTNGINSIFISECDDTVNENVNVYVNGTANRNLTYNITNYTLDDVLIVKVSVNDANTTHYWFSYNGKTYTVYSWDKNDDLDSIVFELIKTVAT